jgi:Cys-rich repeat protein
MLRRLMLPLVCCFAGFAGFASSADAAPVVLGKSESVANARLDPGTGICGSVSKFANQPTPLVTVEQASMLMNRPMGDPAIIGKVSRLFQNMNFSIGPGSEADFKAPAFNDDAFPYCQDPLANPMGPDDNNLLMRIRGYLNVTQANRNVTIAVKCDDGCQLRMGKTKQLVTEANDDNPTQTGRRARWVTFTDPGLYPIEMVYFQNSTTGYMEWSIAPGQLFPGDDVSVDNLQWAQNMGQFKPITGSDLYSAIIGANPSCIECGEVGMDCSMGNYCGDGLCQSCNIPDRCGPTCMTCPANARVCSAGKCVQCTDDSHCPVGTMCDVASGTCGPPMGCMDDAQCKPGQICRPEKICGTTPDPCKTNAECLSGYECLCPDFSTGNCTQKVCLQKPMTCTADENCPTGYHCDIAAQICKLNDRYLYEGGLVGCDMGDGHRSNANGISVLALLGLALFGFAMRLRRDQKTAPARRDALN